MSLLVLGNAMVDHSYALPRLPQAGETLLATGKRAAPGGKGLNQAVVAHRAGAKVRFVAALGDDPDGRLIRATLAAEGLATDGLVTVDSPSDESAILVGADGENLIVSTAAAAAALPRELAEAEAGALAPGDRLLLQGNLTREATESAMLAARGRSASVLLNPAPIAFDYAGLLELADVAVFNEVEAAALGRRRAKVTVLTRGARGLVLEGPDGALEIPAPPVQAVDATGAGDVVCGVLAAGLELGLPMPASLRWAVAAAALKVARAGAFAGLPTAAELAELRP